MHWRLSLHRARFSAYGPSYFLKESLDLWIEQEKPLARWAGGLFPTSRWYCLPKDYLKRLDVNHRKQIDIRGLPKAPEAPV